MIKWLSNNQLIIVNNNNLLKFLCISEAFGSCRYCVCCMSTDKVERGDFLVPLYTSTDRLLLAISSLLPYLHSPNLVSKAAKK